MRSFLLSSFVAIVLSLSISCKKKEPPKGPATPVASTPAPGQGAPPAPAMPAAPEVYKPRYAQRMFEVLTRFYLAGAAAEKGNWGLVYQEAFELSETFKYDLTKVLPAVRIPAGVDLKGLRSAFTNTQLSGLLAAAEKKDKAGFLKSYAETAAGCNGCHNQINRAFLVIKDKPQATWEDVLDIGAGAGK
jgi:hypothetical protein